MVLALLDAFIVTLVFRKTTPAAERLFRWFITAISLTIIRSTFHFVDAILNGVSISDQWVYLIFYHIVIRIQYLADALLLGAINIYLITCAGPRKSGLPASQRKAPKLLHRLLFGLLALLWLFTTFVAVTLATGWHVILWSDVSNRDLATSVGKLDLTYSIICLLATVVATVVAVSEVTTRWGKRGISVAPCQTKKASVLFFILVGLPQLIRSIWLLVISERKTRFHFTLDGPANLYAQLVFYCLCTTLVYIGIAVGIRNIASEAPSIDMNVDRDEEGRTELTELGPELPVMRAAPPAEEVQIIMPRAPTDHTK
ncbi:MAG: hypothetical protein Q9169_005557 [Polycauliona sp. 2 TL-2023]